MLGTVTSYGFKHPWMPTALYLSLGSLLTTLSLSLHPRSAEETVLFILLGVFSWTLIEYILHRFIFHWQTTKEPWRQWLDQAHLEHHRAAMNGEKVLIRPFFALLAAVAVYLFLALISFSFNRALFLETGVFLGYIAYEWIHFAAHRFHPQSRLGVFLKQYHLSHHFTDPRRAFGVTTPFWDWVFGTVPQGGDR